MPPDLQPVFWAVVTIGLYVLSLKLFRRFPRWWTSPLLATWALCFALAIALKSTYQDYIGGTRWLLTMLGPATVAFALPIYEQRQLIRRHWPVLLIGVLLGSAIAFSSAWLLATAFGLSPDLRLSLLPRSVTTPFALEFTERVGGLPELTATCVVITGLFGASLGEILLNWLPLRSAFARGSLFGMGAHAVGTAKAREFGELEGSISGLTMILAGILSVLLAPALVYWLG